MQPEDDIITIYSDYVCPFCYLGRQSLETYQEQRDEELGIEWHPFDLRQEKRGPDGEIDHSIDDGKDEAYFDQVRQNVARLKESYDTPEMLSLDDTPDAVDSFDAQVASMYVKQTYPKRWLEFDEGIFDALWIHPYILTRLGQRWCRLNAVNVRQNGSTNLDMYIRMNRPILQNRRFSVTSLWKTSPIDSILS